MKNTAFRNSLYGGLLIIVGIIGLISSVIYNISIYVKPSVNNLFDVEQKDHVDSSDAMVQLVIVDSSNSKFEVIERPVQKDEPIPSPSNKVTEINPSTPNTIKNTKLDTFIEPKVTNTNKMIIDTTS